MAKGWTVESSEQSTHAKSGTQVPRKSVSSTLLELTVKAKRDGKYRFRSLYREIDLRMLYDSFWLLKPKAAVGVDGVSWHEYENDLDANLRDLLERLKTHRYRAKQIRRKYIPKTSGKLRPLGIPSLEDKIVQMSARRLLEAIYEPIFSDNSMGYRPARGAREASQKLRDELFFGRVHWIVEADIKDFFDHMDHDWLIRMLEERVADRHFMRLIRKWLRAGIFEELPSSLGKFSLEIAPEKSGIVRFSRHDMRDSGRFVYLGFDFYWARTRKGKQTVKRRTNKKKFQQVLKSLKVWLNGVKSKPLKYLAGTLRRKRAGHFNYYGVIGNSHMLSEFFNAARHTIYRVLNSRSQKKSYNWEGFTAMWKTLDIPNPKIIETMRQTRPCLI